MIISTISTVTYIQINTNTAPYNASGNIVIYLSTYAYTGVKVYIQDIGGNSNYYPPTGTSTITVTTDTNTHLIKYQSGISSIQLKAPFLTYGFIQRSLTLWDFIQSQSFVENSAVTISTLILTKSAYVEGTAHLSSLNMLNGSLTCLGNITANSITNNGVQLINQSTLTVQYNNLATNYQYISTATMNNYIQNAGSLYGYIKQADLASIDNTLSLYNYITTSTLTSTLSKTVYISSLSSNNFSTLSKNAYIYYTGTYLSTTNIVSSIQSNTHISSYIYSSYDIKTNNLSSFTLYGDGSNITTASLSDMRRKDDIILLTSSLEKINRLRGVSYTKKGDTRKMIGFIAQEVEAIFPEVISSSWDEDIHKGITYGSLISPLIEAVKELDTSISELENTVTALECGTKNTHQLPPSPPPPSNPLPQSDASSVTPTAPSSAYPVGLVKSLFNIYVERERDGYVSIHPEFK